MKCCSRGKSSSTSLDLKRAPEEKNHERNGLRTHRVHDKQWLHQISKNIVSFEFLFHSHFLPNYLQ